MRFVELPMHVKIVIIILKFDEHNVILYMLSSCKYRRIHNTKFNYYTCSYFIIIHYNNIIWSNSKIQKLIIAVQIIDVMYAYKSMMYLEVLVTYRNINNVILILRDPLTKKLIQLRNNVLSRWTRISIFT